MKRRFGDTEKGSRYHQEAMSTGQVFAASLCCPHGMGVSVTLDSSCHQALLSNL